MLEKKIWTKTNIHSVEVLHTGIINSLDALIHNIMDLEALESLLTKENMSFGIIAHSDNFIIAICDRTQSYPIYYNEKTGDISNHVSDLSKSEIDTQSVLEFATAGYVLGDKTLDKNIKQIQAGELIHIDKTISPIQITKHRYYRYTPTPSNAPKMHDDWIKELENVLDDVIDRMITSIGDRPVCVPLSGGLDSRLILAKLCEHGVNNIQTFSYGLNNNFEAKTAKKVARILGVDWCMVPAQPKNAKALFDCNLRKKYADSTHGCSRIPSYVEFEAIHSLSDKKLIPENAVIVNGQSGDYISGGHVPSCLYEKENPTKNDLYNYIFDKHFSLWENLKTLETENTIKKHIDKTLLPYDSELSRKDNLIRQYESFEWQERQCKMVVNGQKTYDFFGYDWRLPLWDKELMDLFETMPWDLKYNQHLFKSYLKDWNYKGLFDFMSAEPEIWKPNQFWIQWVARAIGIVKSQDSKADFYKKMLYYSDSHWQYALFGKDVHNSHYKNIRNMISLAVRNHLEEENIDFPGDI